MSRLLTFFLLSLVSASLCFANIPHDCGHGHDNADEKVETAESHCHGSSKTHEKEKKETTHKQEHDSCCVMPCCHVVLDETKIELKLTTSDYEFFEYFPSTHMGYKSLELSNIFRPPIS